MELVQTKMPGIFVCTSSMFLIWGGGGLFQGETCWHQEVSLSHTAPPQASPEQNGFLKRGSPLQKPVLLFLWCMAAGHAAEGKSLSLPGAACETDASYAIPLKPPYARLQENCARK